MDNIWIACLVVLVLSILPLKGVEQTYRTVWAYQDEWYSLYRVEKENYRSEILLSAQNPSETVKPARFILVSPYCTIGNIQPTGLFRFFEMDSLLIRGELTGRAGYCADSSADNLNSSGGAFYWEDTGGVFFESIRSEFLNGGLWYNCQLIPYLTLDFAMDFSLPGEEVSSETSWFLEETPHPEGTLYHGGGDIRYDSAIWSGRLKGGLSFGTNYLPGSSLLPEVVLYLRNVSLSLRYWRNSESYRNRFCDFPDRNWQLQGEIQYQNVSGFWSGSAAFGRPRPSREDNGVLCREYQMSWQKDVSCMHLDLEGAYSYDRSRDSPYEIHPEGGISARFSSWSVGGETDFIMEGLPYILTDRTASITVRYSHHSAVWFRGEVAYHDNPEEAVFVPLLESGIHWNNWQFKGTSSYDFFLYGKEDSLFSLRVSAEWSL